MKPKLTILDQDFDTKVASTPIGMAFWTGTGPGVTTCRECLHYIFEGYRSNRGSKGGMLKPGACKEFIRITYVETHKIPFETQSCKFYKDNPKPPPIINPRKY